MGYSNDDMIGKTFGRLTVVGYAGARKQNGCVRRLWNCECSCGGKAVVDTKNLTTGNTKSCGCLAKEIHSKKRIDDSVRNKHESLRAIWKGMKSRCYNHNNPEYNRYGGRGITICDKWLKTSKEFIEWGLNNGYEIGLSIDRIDTNGNYEPSNCQFITRSENVLKEKKTMTIAGVTLRYTELSEIIGFNGSYLSNRISRVGVVKAVAGLFRRLVLNVA